MNRYKLKYQMQSQDNHGGSVKSMLSAEFNADTDKEAVEKRAFFKEKGVKVGPLFRIETKEVFVRT